VSKFRYVTEGVAPPTDPPTDHAHRPPRPRRIASARRP
jgi:hypothetical protein